MSTSSERPVGETKTVISPRDRTRARAAAFQARATEVAERAQAERANHDSLDAAFELVDRDTEVAGGIIAGALGIAAGLLLCLDYIARLMVGAAVLNATPWERHVRNAERNTTADPASSVQAERELGAGLA